MKKLNYALYCIFAIAQIGYVAQIEAMETAKSRMCIDTEMNNIYKLLFTQNKRVIIEQFAAEKINKWLDSVFDLRVFVEKYAPELAPEMQKLEKVNTDMFYILRTNYQRNIKGKETIDSVKVKKQLDELLPLANEANKITVQLEKKKLLRSKKKEVRGLLCMFGKLLEIAIEDIIFPQIKEL